MYTCTMRKSQMRKKIVCVFMMIFAILCLGGCGREGKDVDTENTQTEIVEEDALYLIVENDTLDETLLLYSYATGMEHFYEYSFSTQFMDKYGNYASYNEFDSGRVVTIGKTDIDGYLTTVQLSDQVWEYDKVRRFSVDEERGVFTIADTNYSIQDNYYIFSAGERIYMWEISEDDILTVVGQGNKILSIVVTTGHGTLSLRNTDLFEGSFLQLNNDIFAIITDNMDMELPEGEYILKVANDGWGGSTLISIVRGETTEVDLDTLKGEGKKRGIIHFSIDVEDVKVYVDYELVDHTKPLELTYGTHMLQIEAEGYDAWKKHLFVNSEESTIWIELEEDEDASESASDTEEDTEEETEEADEQESETEDTETESTETEG